MTSAKQKAVPVAASKPKLTREELLEMIKEDYPIHDIADVVFVGIRGYYKKSLGNPSANDRKIYDDAIFILTKDEIFAYNANVDPGAFKKGIASLIPGVYPAYKFDLHKGKYLAICQRAAKVTVNRDDIGYDTGMFGINIHKGGINQVSSLGCQTIVPSQWDSFIVEAQTQCRKYFGTKFKALTYTYILLSND